MIYSDIKIFFTHKKQEILSPANKLEKRTHNDSIELNENKNAPGGINEFLNMERLSELEPTLKRLREIEQLLNKSFL